LKEIEVRGDIRTTVECLVQLLETKAFIENTIDTSWLDGILKERSVKVDMPNDLVVVSAAIYRAFVHVKEGTKAIMASFEKGQVGTSGIPAINSFEVDVPYKDNRYTFHMERTGSDTYRLTLGTNTIEAKVTAAAEGALLAVFGGENHRIFGMEEPLGLRLQLDGATILMPSIVDPSEFRTDVTGKVVRCLKDNGEEIKAGEPYVEIEAMKMIMPVKATETGKIINALSPGSVIAAGDLLATIELKDPSKVKKIETFVGSLGYTGVAVDTEATDKIKNVLAGYDGNPNSVVQQAFDATQDMESASQLAVDTLEEFLRVENLFAGKLFDDVVRDLTKTNIDNLEVAVNEIQAHKHLKIRSALVLAVLRQAETFHYRFGGSLPQTVLDAVQKLTGMGGKEYGELVVASDMLICESKVPSFVIRVEELKGQLLESSADLQALALSPTLSAGLDLLTYLLSDEDTKVRENAAEVYIRRLYIAHRILSVDVSEDAGRLTCKFTFQYAEVEESQSITQTGLLSVIPDTGSVKKVLPDILGELSEAVGDKQPSVGGMPINFLHLVTKDGGEVDVGSFKATLGGQESKLKQLGVRLVNLCVPKERHDPAYYTFPSSMDYNEDILRRDMRPTRYQLLELGPLSDNFNLERLPAIGKNNQVFVGTETSDKPFRGGPPQVVFVRGISHSSGLVSAMGALRVLQSGLDELERAQASEKVNPQASCRVYLHSLAQYKDVSAEDLARQFTSVMGALKSQLAQRLLRLQVDEIEVKFRISGTGEDGKPVTEVVRLVGSSMGGQWLQPSTYIETPDPVTGLPAGYCKVTEKGDLEDCLLDPYATSNIIQTKRSIARRVGSTYAYDFLGLMEVNLIGNWESYVSSLGGISSGVTVPTDVFESQELIEGPDGNL